MQKEKRQITLRLSNQNSNTSNGPRTILQRITLQVLSNKLHQALARFNHKDQIDLRFSDACIRTSSCLIHDISHMTICRILTSSEGICIVTVVMRIVLIIPQIDLSKKVAHHAYTIFWTRRVFNAQSIGIDNDCGKWNDSHSIEVGM